VGPAFSTNAEVNVANEADGISVPRSKYIGDLMSETVPIMGVEHPPQERAFNRQFLHR